MKKSRGWELHLHLSGDITRKSPLFLSFPLCCGSRRRSDTRSQRLFSSLLHATLSLVIFHELKDLIEQDKTRAKIISSFLLMRPLRLQRM